MSLRASTTEAQCAESVPEENRMHGSTESKLASEENASSV